MIVASSIVFLPCTDIRRTVEFYHDTLGLPIAQRQSETLCIFNAAGGYWGFCQYADGRKPLSGPQGACLSLNLESNEAVWTMYERLKDRCPVHRAPAQHPDFPGANGRRIQDSIHADSLRQDRVLHTASVRRRR